MLRVIITTTAFNMGIDLPDIHQVFHFGAPCDIEQYLRTRDRLRWEIITCHFD